MKESQAKYQGSKRRIAKNTLLLYFRQVLIIIVSLYTSRVVLSTLGVDDFGIYSLIGSFVTMFGVLSGAFVVAITRYISYAMGEGDLEKLISLYSTTMWMQIILGAGIFLLILGIGLYYVSYVMVLPAGRMEATIYVLFFAAVSFYINLLSVPYNALIVGHEHMQAFAYIALVDVFLRLIVVLSLPLFAYDKLIAYGFMTVLASIIVRWLYMIYCRHNFAECVFRRHIDWQMLKEMMKFIQWAVLGNGAVVLKDQGISIILNLFLGTGINAARGLASSVNSAVMGFSHNFIQAVQPQITKLYSSGQQDAMCNLICVSCRMSFYLILLLSLPVIKQIDYILEVWLGLVPEFTNIFIVLTLLDSMVNSISQPLLYGTLAEGKIKVYEILLTTTFLASLPLSYVLLAMGHSPVDIYILVVFLRILVQGYLIWQGYRYGMKFSYFSRQVFFYALPVAVLSGAGAYFLDMGNVEMGVVRFLLETTVIMTVTLLIIMTIGVKREERGAVLGILRSRLQKIFG